MSDNEDTKPDEAGGGGANEQITIRVKDQTGEETMFKIKKSTKMSKVFSAYAQRKGVEASSIRFLLDGERINDTDTPKMLELEDEDQIDCVLQQVGGADDDEDNKEDVKPEGGGGEAITIRVKDQKGEETMFKIKKTTKMKKVFTAYASRQGLDVKSMRFMLDGENINEESTPADMDLEDNDQIDCFLAQVGGGERLF